MNFKNLTEHPFVHHEVKKTSNDWYIEVYPNCELTVLDPDGWDRTNLDYSWGEELITLQEFTNRLDRSTCIFEPPHYAYATGATMSMEIIPRPLVPVVGRE